MALWPVLRRDITPPGPRLETLARHAHLDVVHLAITPRWGESEQVLAVQFVDDARESRSQVLVGSQFDVAPTGVLRDQREPGIGQIGHQRSLKATRAQSCLLYTSDAADERSSVDLG